MKKSIMNNWLIRELRHVGEGRGFTYFVMRSDTEIWYGKVEQIPFIVHKDFGGQVFSAEKFLDSKPL